MGIIRGIFARAASFVLLALFVFTLKAAPAASGQDLQVDPYALYGIGGGGQYDPDLKVQWWRDWDTSYRYEPGVAGRPPNKMWTVGKIDNRRDGFSDFLSTSRENIDRIFDYESKHIQALIEKGYTGQHWEIANEPNWFPRFSPEDYAYAFHRYCGFIKSHDPTARCLNGGLVTVGEWREWLSGFLEAYRNMYGKEAPVDVWSLHPYDLFDEYAAERTIAAIQAFRAEVGFGPIWITEFGYGSWLPMEEDLIVRYIETVCGWLNENHGAYQIERWFWWGVLAGPRGMGSGGLFSTGPYNQQSITAAGQAYFRMRSSMAPQPTPSPTAVEPPHVHFVFVPLLLETTAGR